MTRAGVRSSRDLARRLRLWRGVAFALLTLLAAETLLYWVAYRLR